MSKCEDDRGKVKYKKGDVFLLESNCKISEK